MELSGPTMVMPNRELIAARAGKAGPAVDPFFTNVKGELSEKGFLVAKADNLIAWARTGSLMWMHPCARSTTKCRSRATSSPWDPARMVAATTTIPTR